MWGTGHSLLRAGGVGRPGLRDEPQSTAPLSTPSEASHAVLAQKGFSRVPNPLDAKGSFPRWAIPPPMGEPIGKLLRDVRGVYVKGLPKTVFWAIINHCNATCTTCGFYLVPSSQRQYLDLVRAKQAIEILHGSDVRFTSITGGEPLMNPDVFGICEAVTRRGIVITYMPTNGTLVDDVVARRLRDVDVRVIGVSVEPIGPDGMGSTRRIPRLRDVLLRAREALERAGVPNYAGVLLTKATRDIRAIMECVSELGFDKVVFSYPQKIQDSSYMAARAVPEIELTVEEVESMVAGIKAARHEYPEIGIYNTDESLDDLVRFYRGEPRRYGCWGGRRLFYLDWNLDLYRCFTLPRRYGNLLDLGRVDLEEPELCDLCTQQAFRDFSPFYAAGYAAGRAWEHARSGHPLLAAQTVLNPDAVDGFRALVQVYQAGFI